MKLTNLDKILLNLDLVASFRNFDSSTELNGDRCKIILDYIKELENVIKSTYKGVKLTDEQKDLVIKLLGK